MTVTFVLNIILILMLVGLVGAFFYYKIKKTDRDETNDITAREREKYSIGKSTACRADIFSA